MKCKNCGKEFTRTNPRQKYCSLECRLEYNAKKATAKREKARAKNPIVKTCVVCGKQIAPPRIATCSEECSKIHKRRYEAEAWQRDKAERKAARERRKEEKEIGRERERKKRKKPALSTAQINALARSEGLSYGQYCAKHNLY